ncbi:hypothetical protein CEE36_08430 [candidate division TA06 bacterium B3_TA06]|uniref:Bulb-type lectin domain-containing protein n=1 Tax=candidate division TA06 bacterium B3_TA06 TaxID=2012487 RepID=A0A532V2H5_UNCT6|nr:MAG: hypothetical protein CEE36_08430 [candidate division TA06 bacterium B3_TA06]
MTKQRANASFAGIALFLFATTLAAQVTEEWVARYDGPASGRDEARAMVIDDSGNVYVTGYSDGSGTLDDYATVKYNSSGTVQWVARYDGPASYGDDAKAIAIDAAGNVYVTGDSWGSRTTYATVKYNSSGVEEWAARYDEPESYGDYATAIAVDDAGNVYVTGYSYGLDFFGYDYVTVKYSPNGEEQWVARYDGPVSGRNIANAIAVDGAGNVYVTGWSDGSGTHPDYATIKYSPSGAELWVARYDGPASDVDAAWAMAIDDKGNIYVTGESDGSGTGKDYTTVKYDSSGVEQWVARYDGLVSSIDEAYAIALNGSGNVYVTGYSYGSGTDFDYATVKYDSSGVEQWVARYSVSADFADELRPTIAVGGSGNVYITATSQFEDTEYDYVTIKYNSAGEEQWIVRYNGPGNDDDAAVAIAVDNSDNVYVTGYSMGEGTSYDYATIKYSQGPGVAEASPDVPGHRLEVAQLTPEPVITYTLPSSSSISLKVYDVTGKLVRTLVSGNQEAGTHTACWDARNDSNQQVSAGLYFVLLETADYRATGKLVVVR